MSIEELRTQVLKLTLEERRELAYEMLRSLHDTAVSTQEAKRGTEGGLIPERK
jgi:hypothetical protein